MRLTPVVHFPRARLARPAALALLLAGCSSLSLPGTGDLISPHNEVAGTVSTAPRPQPDARGVISYPNYQMAVAGGGDTVNSIAARLGLDAAALARTNGLPADSRLRPGELVLLPTRVAEAGPAVPQTADGSVDVAGLAGDALDRASSGGTPTPSAATSRPGGPEPVRHRVVRGESAYSIARRYNVSARALGDWNGLDANLTVREGQVLLIPVATGTAAGDTETASEPGTGTPTPIPPSAAQPQPDEDLPSVAEAAANGTAPASGALAGAQTAASDTTKLLQPVAGRITRGYQPGRNEGLDFGAAAGAPVRAADAGTVAAITRDTDQVPILVLRHSGNLLTVYANIDNIQVEKGARVQRGQTIASVRASDPPFLHFEVRQGFDSVDPLDYLTP